MAIIVVHSGMDKTFTCAECGQDFTKKKRSSFHKTCSDRCAQLRENSRRRLAYAEKHGYRKHIIAKSKAWRKNNPTLALEVHAKFLNKNPFYSLLTSAKVRAKKKRLKFDLTIEWARARWTGRCEMTNLPFAATNRQRGGGKKGGTAFSPSIDRIDNTRGYTQDNCWFVLLAINAAKRENTIDDLYIIMEAAVERRRKTNVAA